MTARRFCFVALVVVALIITSSKKTWSNMALKYPNTTLKMAPANCAGPLANCYVCFNIYKAIASGRNLALTGVSGYFRLN
jgi:hypothetical protein